MAYGLFALEAMACGVPFVQPAGGVFGELAEMGGGVLYELNNPVHLAEKLREVLSNAARLADLRKSETDGRRGVCDRKDGGKFNLKIKDQK